MGFLSKCYTRILYGGYRFRGLPKELPEWYVEKVNSVFSIPAKVLMPLFKGDVEQAMDEARIIWGGVHVRSLIENYMRGSELNNRRLNQTTGF